MELGKLEIVGPYPEPYGGVSVHIKRLRERLQTDKIQSVVYDTSGLKKNLQEVLPVCGFREWVLKFLLSSCRESVVHFHSTDFGWKQMIKFSLMLLFKKKLLITFHNLRYDVANLNSWKLQSIGRILRLIPFSIAVSPEIKRKLVKLGAQSGKIYVIPAFLPPVVRQKDIKAIPNQVWQFIREHRPIVSANAYRITFYNNQDLYGIDLCIKLCENLRKDYEKIGFIFLLPDVGDITYFNRMQQLINKRRLENNFLFLTRPYEFYPILMNSDVFVRPTNTDGDAVSIREALHFKIPVVASDSATRPETTILFKNRDLKDLTQKVAFALRNHREAKKRIERVTFEDYYHQLLQVYKYYG